MGSVGTVYKEAQFPNLKGLKAITPEQVEVHLKLYAGYVKNTNLLNEQLGDLITKRQTGTPVYAELTRRLGFEYNGMRLHEYYFENMSGSGGGAPAKGPLLSRLEESFASFDNWKDDFVKSGSMRGIGWAILFQDPRTGRLSNHWITLHEEGSPVGFAPLLVMDVWEHAFSVYLKPTERARYIEDFFANLDWRVVEQRLGAGAREKVAVGV